MASKCSFITNGIPDPIFKVLFYENLKIFSKWFDLKSKYNVTVIARGKKTGSLSSNPEEGCLYFTSS